MFVNPVFPSWLIIVVLSILALLLFWQEIKKPYRFRTLRITAVILMVLALTGLFLKPSYETTKSSGIILLTPQYSAKKVDSIVLQHPKFRIMHLDSVLPYENSKRLFHDDLSQHANQIKIVIGQGFPRYVLDNFKNNVFEFIPTSPPEGIINLFIPEHNVIDRKSTIKGTLNSRDGKSRIYLSGPGGIEDSVTIKNKGKNDFELSFVPKQSGELLYSLAIDDSIKVSRESLPVRVAEQRPLQILFLHSYPTFETQYLKNFLARKGHSIVLRSRLSKNNFRYEYINHDPVGVNRITPELLKKMDLLITDGNTMFSLTPSEKVSLEKSISSGLGLLHLSPNTTKSLVAFFPFQSVPVKSDTAVLQVGSRPVNFPVPRFRITQNPYTTSVQKNKHGILSGYTFRGAGKIGFQLLQETYQLVLAGDSISYAELWSPLLEQISRSKSALSKVKIATPFPWYENEPIDIVVISSGENISLFNDRIPLPLKEDVTFDNILYARTWGASPGWHSLETSDGTSLRYYVSRASEWKTLSLINQENENKFFASQPNHQPSEKIETREEIPPLIFYLTFLLAGGFLWLAPKL